MQFKFGQFVLIRNLCHAGLRAPETTFALARELIELGEIAEAEIAAAQSAARNAALLEEADKIRLAEAAPK